MTSRRFRLLIGLSILVVACASYQKTAFAQELLAVVNGDSITTAAMESQLERMHSAQMGTQHRGDFSVDRLLQTLINNRLIVQEARSVGLDQDDAVAAKVRNYRETIAYRSLMSDVTPERVPLTDGEVKRGFEKLFAGYRLRMICVNDSSLCASLIDSIRGGAPMSDLAMRHSVDKYREAGGYAGVFTPDQMPVDLQNRLAVADAGDLIGPMLLWRVWTVVHVEEKTKADASLFDSVGVQVKAALEAERRDGVRRHFIDSLRTQISVSIDSAAVDSVIILMQAGAEAPPKPVVIVGENRILTAADLRNKYIHRIAGRTDREAQAVLYEVLRDQVDIMLLKEVAARSEYVNQPRFNSATQAYEDSLLVAMYLTDVVAPSVKVDGDDIEAYYDKHKDAFRKPGRVKIATITRDSMAQAQADYESILAGADFAWVAKQNSIDAAKSRGGTQDWMDASQFSSDLQANFKSAVIGTVFPPVSTDNGIIVFKLLDREDGKPMSLDEARDAIAPRLEQQKQFEAIDLTIQELRKAAEIRIFEETLQSLSVSGPAEQEDSR